MCGKQLFVLALCALVAKGFELGEEGKAYFAECEKKHQIQPEDIIAAVKSKELPKSENGKCFMECVMEKYGVLKDGKFDAARAGELAASKLKDKPDVLEKANQVIEKCAAEVTNPGGTCEYGVELAKCGIKYAKELGIPEPPIGN